MVGQISDLVEKFLNGISGEMFFSTGDVESDYNIIKSTIDHQGYWAGSEYKYYFDDEMNLTKVEERRFGA